MIDTRMNEGKFIWFHGEHDNATSRINGILFSMELDEDSSCINNMCYQNLREITLQSCSGVEIVKGQTPTSSLKKVARTRGLKS